MKYIRAQSGEVYSVSQLMPPSRGIEDIWRLSLITVHGQRQTYAIYSDRDMAFTEYGKVICFLASEKSLYIFEPGTK